MLRGNIPWTTAVIAVVVILSVTALAVVSHGSYDFPIITAFLGFLPGLVAAGYAEKNSRDIHNGVVVSKVVEGTTKALNDTGVTDVVNTSKDSTRLAMQALSRLLETNTAATMANTQQSQEGGYNGG